MFLSIFLSFHFSAMEEILYSENQLVVYDPIINKESISTLNFQNENSLYLYLINNLFLDSNFALNFLNKLKYAKSTKTLYKNFGFDQGTGVYRTVTFKNLALNAYKENGIYYLKKGYVNIITNVLSITNQNDGVTCIPISSGFLRFSLCWKPLNNIQIQNIYDSIYKKGFNDINNLNSI